MTGCLTLTRLPQIVVRRSAPFPALRKLGG
jgi:hypothetical protein